MKPRNNPARRRSVILQPPPKKPNRALAHSKEERARLTMMKKLLRGAGLSQEEARYVVAHSFPAYTHQPFHLMDQHAIERRIEMVHEIQFVRHKGLAHLPAGTSESKRARLELFFRIMHAKKFTPNMIKDKLIFLANRLADTPEKEQARVIHEFLASWPIE